MTCDDRSAAERGFTLIEMLIALAIFALVAAAGVMLLRTSLDTQAQVAVRLGESGGINRLRALLSSELAVAQPRPGRDEAGAENAAFTGGADRVEFVFGAAGDGGAGRLHRVSYALENGRLVRRATDQLDGAAPARPAPLVSDVGAVAWRFRDADGSWSERWVADDLRRLPREVELAVTRRTGVALVLHFAVGPDGLRRAGTEAAAPAAQP